MPTTARYEFHPAFSLSEEYDDNYRLDVTNREDNWRTTAGAGFSLLINDLRTRGYVSTMVNGSWDTAEGGRFTLFPSFTGGLTHTVNPRLSFTLTDTLQRNDDYSQSDRFGVRGQERQLYTHNTFSASMDWLIDRVQTTTFYTNSLFLGDTDTISNLAGFNVSVPIGLSTTVSGGYQFTISRTSDGGAGDETDVGHTVFGSVSRTIGQYASAGVSSSYALHSEDSSRIWNVSAFGTYGLPTGLSVSASFGYTGITADNGVDTGGPTTSTTITYAFARMVASLWAYADFQTTNLTGENLGVLRTKGVTASLSFPITVEMAGGVFASWAQTAPTGVGNDASNPTTNTYSAGASTSLGRFGAGVSASYSDSVLLGSPNAPTFGSDEFSARAHVSYQILSFLNAILSYQYLNRTEEGGKVTQNLATLTLTASF